MFEAEEGGFHQIDVAPGTLNTPFASLWDPQGFELTDAFLVRYDSEGSEVASNNDYGETWAARIYWEADHSGNHYVSVESFQPETTGTYALRIAAR